MRNRSKHPGIALIMLAGAGALAAGGCQVIDHGDRAELRANPIIPDIGDSTSLSTALARSDLIGPAPAPVASADKR